MSARGVEGERLDLVLYRVGQAAARPVTDPIPTSDVAPPLAQEFAAVLAAATKRPRSGRITPSPQEDLIDFLMPRINASILQGGQPVSILEHLISDILPGLDGGDDFRQLAGAVLADEITRQRDLLARIHAGLAV